MALENGFAGKDNEKKPFSNKVLLDNIDIKWEDLIKNKNIEAKSNNIWYIVSSINSNLHHFDAILYDKDNPREFF